MSFFDLFEKSILFINSRESCHPVLSVITCSMHGIKTKFHYNHRVMLILCCIIHCGMVDNTNLIWSYHYLCRFIVCGLNDRTSLIGMSVYKAKYFCNTEIFGSMHGSILKFIACLYMNHHSKLQ